MPVPVIKALITAMRLTLRPINNSLIKFCKSGGNESRSYKFFVRFGQYSNKFEIKMNRMVMGTSGLKNIPELSNKLAFDKGIEWFTEIFFFYGLLFIMAFYELDKAEKASIAQKRIL